MSQQGLKIAFRVGQQLPAFENHPEAERALFARRDLLLDLLRRIVAPDDVFRFDLTPESLKTLERWYFGLLERDQFRQRRITKQQFEECVSMYFGQVVVQNRPHAEWAVEQSAFVPGRYIVGVRLWWGFWSLTTGTELDTRPRNKRRQSLWRDYGRTEVANSHASSPQAATRHRK